MGSGRTTAISTSLLKDRYITTFSDSNGGQTYVGGYSRTEEMKNEENRLSIRETKLADLRAIFN